MKSRYFPGLTPGKEDGAVLIFVVLAIAMFISLSAMAIDAGHMVMVRNELQNAADAGALAGAGVLFKPSDGSINTGTNGVFNEADEVARENPAAGADKAKGSAATDNLEVDVKVGHWSFTSEKFTEAESLSQLENWQGMSAAELDVNTDFINAVQVTTTRENTATIFAGFFGMFDTKIETDAVAYLGFSTSIGPETLDMPFALCKQSIYDGDSDSITCNVARAQDEGIETGGWTNFSQDTDGEECSSSNASDVNKDILGEIYKPDVRCEELNTVSLAFGKGIGSINGAVSSSFSEVLQYCFVDEDNIESNSFTNDSKYTATQPWLNVTMPIVDCVSGDYEGGACNDSAPFIGIVNVHILWMSNTKNNVPVEYNYGDKEFDCLTPSDPAACWAAFQEKFEWDLADPNDDGLPENQTIYFMPTCEYNEAAGVTGAENYGIMAKIPVLVE